MVDSIRIFTKVELKDLKIEKWKKDVDKETGVINYYYNFIGRVRIAYYPDSRSISLSGRYITSKTKDRTKNFDELFTSKEELTEFFKEFESKVNSYFNLPCINILRERVTRIDYVFNLKTVNACHYIKFFNMYYKKIDRLFLRITQITLLRRNYVMIALVTLSHVNSTKKISIKISP